MDFFESADFFNDDFLTTVFSAEIFFEGIFVCVDFFSKADADFIEIFAFEFFAAPFVEFAFDAEFFSKDFFAVVFSPVFFGAESFTTVFSDADFFQTKFLQLFFQNRFQILRIFANAQIKNSAFQGGKQNQCHRKIF